MVGASGRGLVRYGAGCGEEQGCLQQNLVSLSVASHGQYLGVLAILSKAQVAHARYEVCMA